MGQSSFEQWAAAVNKLAFDDGHIDSMPRYVFALYIAGFYAGLTPDQFQQFMSARAFVNVATAPLIQGRISLSRANDFIKEWDLKTDIKAAIPRLLGREEVQEKYSYLFEGKSEF
jgi:hypothetical protein